MSAARTRGSEQPTTAWKIRNSLWVFMCVGTFGLAAPWIILYVGIASRRPAWMGLGALLGAASITSMVWLSGAAIWQRETADWLLMAVWLGGSSFAAGANREYLRIKWAARKGVDAAFPASAQARRARGGAERANRAGTPAAPKRGAKQGAGSVRVEAAEPQRAARTRGVSSPGSGGRIPAAVPTPVPGPGAGPGPGPGPGPNAGPTAGPAPRRGPRKAGVDAGVDTVEVNGASLQEFAALPGFDADLAARAVSLRQGRPYVSVEQFAERLALQPHIFLRVRNRLSCRSASVPPGFGRRVDY